MKKEYQWHDTTVLIKTFERQRALKRLLRSIFRYYPAIPVIIADDGSKAEDNEKGILNLWKDKNIQYICLPYDVGVSEGRNQALMKVQTKYFVLCDDDFVFDRRTNLGLMKRQLENHNVDLVGGMYFEFPKIIIKRCRIFGSIIGLIYDLGFRWPLPFRHVNFGKFQNGPNYKKTKVSLWHIKQGGLIEVDMCSNFFIAKTDIRNKVLWRPELKMAEHRVFFRDFKLNGLKCVVNLDLGVNHIRDAGWGSKYAKLRHRTQLKEFQKLRDQIMAENHQSKD